MSTATIESRNGLASNPSDAPQEAEIVSAFYGQGAAKGIDLPKPDGTPAAEQPGSSATPKASADSPAKADAAPTGQETPKAEETPEAKPKADDSHHAVAARRLGNQVKDLTTQLSEALEKIKTLETKDDQGSKTEPTPEEIRAIEHFKGREQASRSLAFDRYGEAVVKEKIYGVDKDGKDLPDGGEYFHLVKEQPWIQLEVRQHPQPTMAAMRALERQAFIDRYGEDPTQWAEKVIAEAKPKIIDEFKRHTAAPPTGTPPPTVTGTRGESGPERTRSMTDVFYGKAAS